MAGAERGLAGLMESSLSHQHLEQSVVWTEQPKNLGDITQVIGWAGGSHEAVLSPADA